jgi:hypothetical protein
MTDLLLWSCGIARTTLPPQLAWPTLPQVPCQRALASRAGRGSPLSRRPPGEVLTRGYSPMRHRTIRRSGSQADWRGGIVDTEAAQPWLLVLLSLFDHSSHFIPTTDSAYPCVLNLRTGSTEARLRLSNVIDHPLKHRPCFACVGIRDLAGFSSVTVDAVDTGDTVDDSHLLVSCCSADCSKTTGIRRTVRSRYSS